jgi:hypothetical protein
MSDVVERIEAKAKGEGRPFNRILANELALFPHLDRQARLGELVRDMESVLARYGSRTTVTELSESLARPASAVTASAAWRGCRPDQLVATASFMAAGFLTVFVVRNLIAWGPLPWSEAMHR